MLHHTLCYHSLLRWHLPFSSIVSWVGGRTLAQLMCVFLCADSCPLEKEEKEAQGYGLSAQLIGTQLFSELLLALLFQDW